MKLLIAVIVFVLVGTGLGQSVSESRDLSRKEAERIWELAIAARGGRDRMLAVQNMVITSRSGFSITSKDKFVIPIRNEFTWSPLEKYRSEIRYFLVFPDKSWSWEDYRPSVFGVTVRMYNWEIEKKYVESPYNQDIKLQPMDEIDYKRLRNKEGKTLLGSTVMYLPETRWWKTIPLAVKTGKLKGKKVYIVQTHIDEGSSDNVETPDVAFYLCQETYLPIRITFLKQGDSIDYSDYAFLNGFRMATKMKATGEKMEQLSFQFNTKYNGETFTTPPPPMKTLDEAWKWVTGNRTN